MKGKKRALFAMLKEGGRPELAAALLFAQVLCTVRDVACLVTLVDATDCLLYGGEKSDRCAGLDGCGHVCGDSCFHAHEISVGTLSDSASMCADGETVRKAGRNRVVLAGGTVRRKTFVYLYGRFEYLYQMGNLESPGTCTGWNLYGSGNHLLYGTEPDPDALFLFR